PVVVVAQVLGDVAGTRGELLQVLTDAEAAPRAGDHDRTHRVVRGCRLQGGEDAGVDGRVERVENVRAVERDRQDGCVPGDIDVGHVRATIERPAAAPLPSCR